MTKRNHKMTINYEKAREMWLGLRVFLVMGWLLADGVSFVMPQSTIRRIQPLYMNTHTSDRRKFLWGIMSGTSFLLSSPAQAMGLMQFPCDGPLMNTYYFMRAGQSLMEADDIWSTNPLFLTNREAALSLEGMEQVEAACQFLAEQGILPSIVRYSLAASAMDTANIIGRELKVGRDRLVPEFTYMDPRAVGKWDMLTLSSTEAAVWAMDAAEAGAEGRGARPPPHEDGTPHETLADQSTRLRQLFSVLETQYSGDTVVLVFPDGTGPALLSAMIAGIPLNRVHQLEYHPGEVRLNVTKESVLEYLKNDDRKSEYDNVIAAGRKELKRLRAMKADDLISVKDQKLEKDRLEMEEYSRKLQEKRLAKEEKDRLAREARVKQVEESRQRRRGEQGDTDVARLTPVLLGAAAVGASAVAVATLGGGNNEKETVVTSDGPLPILNTTETAPLDAKMDVKIMDGLTIDIPEMRQLDTDYPGSEDEEGLVAHAQRVNGDRQATFPPRRKARDPVKAAEEAMREYLDTDDGGGAWLAMLSDIMVEEEEGEGMNDKNP